MAVSISAVDFKSLRDYIEENCGIALGDEKAYLIETRLTKLMVQNGCDDFGAFYRKIKADPTSQLRDKIVDAMTTNETLWFRDQHPYVILKEKLLPEMAALLSEKRRLRVRIWSGASSTGQEPYSIAMTIHEFCRAHGKVTPQQFEIVATDISPSALFIANSGRYDQIAMSRGMSDEMRARYFKQEGHVWVMDESVRKMVIFKRFNLQDPPDALGKFDIVFLRYVAIYFSASLKQKIFSNIARLLAPSGYFIIGAVESLRGFNDDFEALSHATGTYYKCKG